MDNSARAAIEAFKLGAAEIYGERLRRIVVFGSHARGEATRDSDLDLLVVLDGEVSPHEEIDRLADLTWDIDLEYGVLLAVVPVSAADYRRRESLLLINVRREGVNA